jgi:hypothetical protein
LSMAVEAMLPPVAADGTARKMTVIAVTLMTMMKNTAAVTVRLSLPPDWILANSLKTTPDLLFVVQAVGPIELFTANVDEIYSLVMESERELEHHSCA